MSKIEVKVIEVKRFEFDVSEEKISDFLLELGVEKDIPKVVEEGFVEISGEEGRLPNKSINLSPKLFLISEMISQPLKDISNEWEYYDEGDSTWSVEID